MEKAESSPIQFYHACTDGTSNGIVYFNDDDYRRASTTAAIAAYKSEVRIMAYVHMSTHSHFVIWCSGEDEACKFINEFKRAYSQYIFFKYNISGIYSGIGSRPRRITGIFDLKESGFLVDETGNIAPCSFVDAHAVERLFGGLTELYRALALTDYAGQDRTYVPRTITYDDNELRADTEIP